MQTSALQQRLVTYQQWKVRVERAVRDLETWLDEHRRATPSARHQVRTALQFLAADRITVALVAESSRGKRELINALFFSDPGGRLLPTTVGPTPCPTEVLWDDVRSEPYLRLLPVETRVRDTPLAQLRSDPKHWVHYPLTMQDPEQTADTLSEIRATKTVSLAEATRLGLSSTGPTIKSEPASDTVEIPKWRHAIVSLPHPLLKKGLVVLDIPGIAVLGAEPELTVNTLAAAQAVLFVLAADTGVTRADREIWQHHLKGFQSGRSRATLVALNKIDSLWDDRTEAEQQTGVAIAAHRATTAQALGIGDELVFPVSAKKAMMAKTRGDEGLLRRSALPALERHLATRMLEAKYQSVVAALDATVGQVLDRNRSRISSRIARVKSQLDELEQLREESQTVIGQLLEKTRREQERYLKSVQQFQQGREDLLAQTRECRRVLEAESIEAVLARGQREMATSWTTAGLLRSMKRLFEDLRRTMQSVADDSERTRKLVREIYQGFREDFGFDLITPKVFVPMKYRVEIELLYQEVETFRRSPQIILAGRGRVVRRFNQQLVSRAQVLFEQLRIAFDGWIRDTLQPLADEIQEHKTLMEKRLEHLQQIGRSKEALQKRIDAMQNQCVGLAQGLTALRNICNALHYDPLTEQEAPQRPRLVSG
jgi:hypothetical protein